MRRFITLALAPILASCATTETCTNPTEGTDSAARAAFLYAQLASNAYEPHDAFVLPNVVKSAEHYPNDSTGMAYSVYRVSFNAEDQIVVAFRGTEGLTDWILGNVLGKQNDRGLDAFRRIRSQAAKDVPVVLVGHSLGGAIALHISLREKGVVTYAFNPSTRFTRGPAPQVNPRTLISEYGEANRVLDWLTIDPKSDAYIVSCTYGNAIKNHGMFPLAACLTRIAAANDQIAAWSVSANAQTREATIRHCTSR